MVTLEGHPAVILRINRATLALLFLSYPGNDKW